MRAAVAFSEVATSETSRAKRLFELVATSRRCQELAKAGHLPARFCNMQSSSSEGRSVGGGSSVVGGGSGSSSITEPREIGTPPTDGLRIASVSLGDEGESSGIGGVLLLKDRKPKAFGKRGRGSKSKK